MSKMRLKLVLAGVLAACAFVGIASGIAWATAASGVSTVLSGPVLFDDVKVKSDSDVNKVEIHMKGSSDVYVVTNTIAPGGHTGWHSHPGISFVTVKSGTATEYSGDDPTTPNVYPAGTGLVEEAGHVHIIRNLGTTDLVLFAFQIIPHGAQRRIDAPAP